MAPKTKNRGFRSGTTYVATSKYKLQDYELINQTQAIQRQIPKEGFFSSQQYLYIQKIAPHGILGLKFLVGDSYDQNINLPKIMDIGGSYVFEGYGISDIYKIRKDVPIKYDE